MDGAAAGMTAAAQTAAAEAAQHAAAASAEPAAAAAACLGDTEGSARGIRPPLKATARKTTICRRTRATTGSAEQHAAASSSGGLSDGFWSAVLPRWAVRACQWLQVLHDTGCQQAAAG